MPTLGLVNIGALATGVLAAPRAEAEAILVENGRIAAIGAASRTGAGSADVVVDCLGTTVIPGLIDSHCHVVLGDYTPRQKTVDFLDSYVHGGITSVVSAGEGVHAPGRPHDPVAAKALAIAAAKCFEHFHPNGMKVNAGSVVLEPGLTDEDFAEMAKHGVRHAKYGFGGYAQPRDGEPEVRRAQKHGLCVMSHSGGTSIPGSSPISHDVLLHLRPDVCGHVNGGTTSLDEAGIDRIIAESEMALQIVQAGNLRAALHIVRRAREAGDAHGCHEERVRARVARRSSARGRDRAGDREQRARVSPGGRHRDARGRRPGRSGRVRRAIGVACRGRDDGDRARRHPRHLLCGDRRSGPGRTEPQYADGQAPRDVHGRRGRRRWSLRDLP